MKITRFLALTVALAPAIAFADLSPDAFKQLSAGNKTEKAMIEMYVGGVVKGYLNANGMLSSVGQKPLFCFDGDIDTGQAHKIAANAIKEHLAKSPGDSKKEIVEVLLMMKLKAMHPC
jgi:hypothetical protein